MRGEIKCVERESVRRARESVGIEKVIIEKIRRGREYEKRESVMRERE